MTNIETGTCFHCGKKREEHYYEKCERFVSQFGEDTVFEDSGLRALSEAAPYLLAALESLLENQGYDGRHEDGVGYRSEEQEEARTQATLLITKLSNI